MIYNTYVQQLSFDGLTYTKGSVVDLLKSFNIISQDFPFVKHPEPKELPSRDWYGEDGLDVYVPDQLPIKNYEIEVVFLYTRNLSMNSGEEDIAGESPVEKRDRLMRRDISNFLDFLYGRSKGSVNDTVWRFTMNILVLVVKTLLCLVLTMSFLKQVTVIPIALRSLPLSSWFTTLRPM